MEIAFTSFVGIIHQWWIQRGAKETPPPAEFRPPKTKSRIRPCSLCNVELAKDRKKENKNQHRNVRNI